MFIQFCRYLWFCTDSRHSGLALTELSGFSGNQRIPRFLEHNKKASCIHFELFFFFDTTLVALLSSRYGKLCWKILRVLQSDTHLSWTPASLVNEERSASFLGSTNRCILQLHASSCLRSGPFVWRRCYSKVGTPTEFKWASSEWSNTGRLAEASSFHGLYSYCAISEFRY